MTTNDADLYLKCADEHLEYQNWIEAEKYYEKTIQASGLDERKLLYVRRRLVDLSGSDLGPWNEFRNELEKQGYYDVAKCFGNITCKSLE